MAKTMKIIELFSKMARIQDGSKEMIPKKIKLEGVTFEWINGAYRDCSVERKYISEYFRLENMLNETVQIQEEILDAKEKEYLRNVIRPFRYRVKYIMKDFGCNTEYIHIRLVDDDLINLPYFKQNTMYKNMELDKKYTLEELGI